jgi:hypothetical protein
MRSFTFSLAELCKKEWVSVQTAMSFAPNQNALDSAAQGAGGQGADAGAPHPAGSKS